MKRSTFPMIMILIFLFTQSSGYASYISDGSLIILRSQYLDDDQDIAIDGLLNEDIWDKAGSLTVSFTQPDNITITMYFFNTQNYLYFAIVATELSDDAYDSLSLTFDTEADGTLVSPEDGVRASGTNTVSDLYWNGEQWVNDENPSSNDFDSYLRRTTAQRILEIRKSLTPVNLPYNGFRIPNPSNTFISFNVQYIESRAINETHSTPLEFNFPASQTNSSGYIDLKLAGAEDQDLPEFIPPETFTQNTNDPPASNVINTLAGILSFNPLMVSMVIAITIGIYRRRRAL